jgi:hypothetical protein
MKHTFYAVRVIETGELCEVEGGTCYDSYATMAEAMESAKQCNDSCRKYHKATADVYDVVPLPAGIMPTTDAVIKVLGLCDEALYAIIEKMNAEFLDYYIINNELMIQADIDGYFITDYDNNRVAQAAYSSWLTDVALPNAEQCIGPKRTVFGLLAVDRVFQFIGNPIIFRKISDFSAEVLDTPYPRYDDDGDTGIISMLDGKFGSRFNTDAFVDFNSDIHLIYEAANAKRISQA